MVKINKIYTKTGDAGETHLVNGRTEKTSQRIGAIGAVDELNAMIGLALCDIDAKRDDILGNLFKIQHDLFDLGADLATPGAANDSQSLRIIDSQVEALEALIDTMTEKMKPLTSFILPGGSQLAARLHLARTICRRAERECWLLAAEDPDLNQAAVRYLNRLSDTLFAMGRWANQRGEADIQWIPGFSRKG